jgi:hypothetical protein
MTGFLPKGVDRKLEAAARILEFCKEPRGFNEIVTFSEERDIYSRMKVKELLIHLREKNFLRLDKGLKGKSDSYLVTEEGIAEVSKISGYQRGILMDPVLTGEMEITITLKKGPETSLIGEALRDMEIRALQGNPERQKVLGTLIGSLIKSYSLATRTESEIPRGAFVEMDGRFVQVSVCSKRESDAIREMIHSGHLDKGNEVQHISQLLHVFGMRALMEIYSGHKRTNFEPNSLAYTGMLLALDKAGHLGKGLAEFETTKEKIKIWKQIRDSANTQIRILSQEA